MNRPELGNRYYGGYAIFQRNGFPISREEDDKSETPNVLRAIIPNYSIGSMTVKLVPWPSMLSTSMVPECCSMMA